MPLDEYGNEYHLDSKGWKKKGPKPPGLNKLPNPVNPPMPKGAQNLPPGWSAWNMFDGTAKLVDDIGHTYIVPIDKLFSWKPQPDFIKGLGSSPMLSSESVQHFYPSDLVKETEKKEHPLNFISGHPPNTSSVKLSDLYKDDIVESGKSELHAGVSVSHLAMSSINALAGVVHSGVINESSKQASKSSKWETEEATVSDHEDFAQVLEFLADRIRSAKPGSLAIEQALTNFTEEDGPLVGKPAVHNMVQSIWARREVSIRVKFDS